MVEDSRENGRVRVLLLPMLRALLELLLCQNKSETFLFFVLLYLKIWDFYLLPGLLSIIHLHEDSYYGSLIPSIKFFSSKKTLV